MMQYLISKKQIKRLCIYFFYDEQGVLDDYVIFYLEELKKYCDTICVVVNGFLTQESKSKLNNIVDNLIIRDNVGFDAWAYKEALQNYTIEGTLQTYDEVILNNFTCYGPIGSFKDMFDTMNNSVCDFWGHFRYFPDSKQEVRNLPIPEHIASYFIVCRKNILQSKAFKIYWETLNPIYDYDDSRIHHEFRFTDYFEKKGFISDVYINDKRSKKFKTNLPVYNAYEQLVFNKSPLLKRKVFFAQEGLYIHLHKLSYPDKVIKYIKKNNLYSVDYITQNLLRTKNINFPDEEKSYIKEIAFFILGKILNIKKFKIKYKFEKSKVNKKLFILEKKEYRR